MARRHRIELPNVPLHVIQRGNNRSLCFVSDADRRLYLKCLARSSVRYECSIHAYVLMPNHVHLLASPRLPGGIGAMMQVGRRYVRLFNETHRRTGTLWEGRYKASLVDTDTYLFICHRYIELNPVRAGLASRPAHYRWSSHRHYAYGEPDALVRHHALFDNLGVDAHTRRQTFLALFNTPLSTKDIELIRIAAQKGQPLCGDTFLNQLACRFGINARPAKRGRPFKDRKETGEA
jgi:putative transposase